MNERIKELALQAGIDFFNSIDPEFHGKEYCEAWTEQQQKFAELCFLECAKWMSDGNISDGGYEAERMLKHFGVEQ